MAHQYTPSLIGYVSEFRSQPREQSRPIMERKRFRANAGRARTLGAALIMAGASMACGAVAAGELYVRAGVGLDRPAETRFMDRDCSSTSPAALYGCGRGEDDTPHRSLGDFGTVNALEMGLGYAFAPSLRIEVLIEHRPRLAFDGRTNFLAPSRQQSVAARLSSLSGMLATFVDLPALGLTTFGPFGPFIGVGFGAVHTEIGAMRTTFPSTTTTVPGASRVDLAWMATAGLAITLSDRATLDIAWRYMDLGHVHTGRGEGNVVWRDGSREPRLLDLAATRAKLTGHGLRLSLRYAF